MKGKSLKEIKAYFEAMPMDQWALHLPELDGDERQGVIKYAQGLNKKLDKLEEEKARVASMQSFEQELAEHLLFCGIDEAGRGPLAGPVVASAVIMPVDCKLLYINDSKKISESKREELYDLIMKEAISVGVGIASPKRIDEINILQATYEAMRAAVGQLDPRPDVLVNDAVRIPGMEQIQKPVIKGDAKCYSIAAASIIAKVTRDRIMRQFDEIYPEYGFAGHKGYGSAAHIEAIKQYGPCPIHRNSFIKNFL